MILNVAPDASDAAVRTAWRASLSDAHPDRVLARGLPAEFVEVAEIKSRSINAAYDFIRKAAKRAKRWRSDPTGPVLR